MRKYSDMNLAEHMDIAKSFFKDYFWIILKVRCI